MPLYICSSPAGTIPQEKKQAIAQGITDVHCTVTGAPPTFVHVFFFEPGELGLLEHVWDGDAASAKIKLFGNIRSGRTDEIKRKLISGIREAVAHKVSVDLAEVAMASRDIQAKWVMEGGDILPEPGEEEAWLEMHNKKIQGL